MSSSLVPVDLQSTFREAFDLCVAKIRSNIVALHEQPTTWAFDRNGDFTQWNEGFFEIGNWTTSFFTGMAHLAWLQTGDGHFLRANEQLSALYESKIREHAAETMHDLGFLYSLYSVALYKSTGSSAHRGTALRAAGVLAARFIPEGGYIRAWGRMDETDSDYAGLAIIDCLMNLPLLFWASEESGDPLFRDIAIRHADTSLALFVREDDSVYHSYRFDPTTGAPTGGDNYCGRAIESQWARGTTWAMYGFVVAYRYTGDDRYLDASLRISRKFLSQLDDELVPLWDFRLPAGEAPLRDSSAAAVAVCALHELSILGKSEPTMDEMRIALLRRLCSDDYLDHRADCRGVMKHGQVGDGVGKARVAYTSWGDYYLMEALGRELGMSINWW